MQRTVSSIDRDKLGAEVAQLEALGLNELRARWRQLYETVPPPRFSRDLLRRAIAYRMQELVLGGLNPPPAGCCNAWPTRPALASRSSSRRCASSNRAPSWSASGMGPNIG